MYKLSKINCTLNWIKVIYHRCEFMYTFTWSRHIIKSYAHVPVDAYKISGKNFNYNWLNWNWLFFKTHSSVAAEKWQKFLQYSKFNFWHSRCDSCFVRFFASFKYTNRSTLLSKLLRGTLKKIIIIGKTEKERCKNNPLWSAWRQ